MGRFPPSISLRTNAMGAAVLLLTMTGALASPAPAQTPPTGQPAAVTVPRVFLDCGGGPACDRNHLRTEIQFVNWAQDREDADVHVIVTSEAVGGGGDRYTLDFIGRGAMAGVDDELAYTASGTDVFAETRDGVTQILRLGLLRYALATGLAPSFNLEYDAAGVAGGARADESGGGAGPTDQGDPWNHWTFQVGLSGDLDLRETSTSIEFSPRLSAERITEAWRTGFQASLDAERDRRELSGGREVRDDRNEWEVEGIVVRSLTNHLSYGIAAEAESSVTQNQDARIELSPAAEYNYFPYSMANRRQLTVQYSAGVQYSNYNEETIFNVTTEVRPQHRLNARYNAREAWGNAGFGVNYSQYLHDVSLYRAGVDGNLSLRITRGLDLNLSGSSSWVHDEIHIPLSDISDEDILLGRLNLPSSYRYTGRVGLSYRWGSAFTNIVNTRFQGGIGGGGGRF